MGYFRTGKDGQEKLILTSKDLKKRNNRQKNPAPVSYYSKVWTQRELQEKLQWIYKTQSVSPEKYIQYKVWKLSDELFEMQLKNNLTRKAISRLEIVEGQWVSGKVQYQWLHEKAIELKNYQNLLRYTKDKKA